MGAVINNLIAGLIFNIILFVPCLVFCPGAAIFFEIIFVIGFFADDSSDMYFYVICAQMIALALCGAFWWIKTKKLREIRNAIIEQKTIIVEKLLKSDENIIWDAVEWGYPDIVAQLLDRGADVNAKNIAGRTALMCAAEKGEKDIVKLLLKRGANINATDNNGKQALDYAQKQCFDFGNAKIEIQHILQSHQHNNISTISSEYIADTSISVSSGGRRRIVVNSDNNNSVYKTNNNFSETPSDTKIHNRRLEI